MARKQHQHIEDDYQQALFDWAALASGRHPELKHMYHIPNGGKRNAIEAARLKRQGVKAGVPDIHLPVSRGGYMGLYIEMKAGKNKPTAKQAEWIKALTAYGHMVVVCYTWTEARDVILGYLGV